MTSVVGKSEFPLLVIAKQRWTPLYTRILETKVRHLSSSLSWGIIQTHNNTVIPGSSVNQKLKWLKKKKKYNVLGMAKSNSRSQSTQILLQGLKRAVNTQLSLYIDDLKQCCKVDQNVTQNDERLINYRSRLLCYCC